MLWALETNARLSDSAKTQSKLAAEPRIRTRLHQSVRQWDTHCLGYSKKDKRRVAHRDSRAEGSSRPPAQHLNLRFVWQFLQQELIVCRGFARVRMAPPAAGSHGDNSHAGEQGGSPGRLCGIPQQENNTSNLLITSLINSVSNKY